MGELLKTIELDRDIPEKGLKTGYLGTIVEEFNDSYLVEFCNELGESICLININKNE